MHIYAHTQINRHKYISIHVYVYACKIHTCACMQIFNTGNPKKQTYSLDWTKCHSPIKGFILMLHLHTTRRDHL